MDISGFLLSNEYFIAVSVNLSLYGFYFKRFRYFSVYAQELAHLCND